MRAGGLSSGAGVVAVVLALGLGCAKDDYVRLYQTAPKAPSLSAQAIENLEHLGPTLIDKGVNFGVYSERATRLELLLFEDPESDHPTRQFPLIRFGDVWNLYVEGIGVGQHYGFIAWGPNWVHEEKWIPGKIDGFRTDVDGEGNRFNPNKLLIDPYAKALHRDHDWGKGSVASGPHRTQVTYGASAKGVVIKSDYAWGPHEAQYREQRKDPSFPGHRWQDLIIYEVHPKGLTRSEASGVAHPGTYRGVGEMADYLKDLGITAVELLPIHEKPTDGGYWGYQTLSFFAPELSYAFAKRPVEIIDEFKWMVEELHKRDIEVILDVVYNHTGEGGLWRDKIEQDFSPVPSLDAQLVNFDPKEIAGIYSFRGLDNAAYYALSDQDPGFYWNNTGVGNQTRPNHRPMRKLIMDSLRYYVEELHVDGFRFDLAPVLGERDQAYYWDQENVRNTVIQDIIDDPVLQAYNTRIIAEPWSLAGAYVGGFPNSTSQPGNGWYEWNGRFRDWWRAFVNFDEWKLSSVEGDGDGGFLMTGADRWYGWNGRRPYHSVNFVTIHDGFTLYDVFSYAQKRNKCGPLNPVCCDQPYSPFCDRDSGEDHNRSRDWGAALHTCGSDGDCPSTHYCGKNPQACWNDERRCQPRDGESLKRQMMRNLFVSLMISHGTPMLLGGDEWMRTQLGNNNAYSTGADNPWNWFDWGVWRAQPDRVRMHDFVRDLIRFRKERAYAFAPETYGGSAPFAWKSAANADMQPADWASKKHVMIHYWDPSKGPELAILINMENGPVTFQAPAGRGWRRLLDTQRYFDAEDLRDPCETTRLVDQGVWSTPELAETPRGESQNITLDAPVAVPGASYGVPAKSIVVLEAS
jgi:isoamylase